MMANSVPSTGMIIVTHVHPQQGAQSVVSPQSGAVRTTSSLLQTFLKAESGVLGTVQIMIGVVEFLFGIVTAIYPAISTYSGVAFWGAIIYIITGSLSVAAHKKLNQCLVKASLGMNIVSTVAAGISIIMYCIDMVSAMSFYYYGCYDEYRYDYSCYRLQALKSNVMGIAGVMLVLSLLEFIVSICVSLFACRATCSSGTEPQVMYVSNQMPSYASYPSAPLQSTPEVPLLPTSVIPPSYHDVKSALNP